MEAIRIIISILIIMVFAGAFFLAIFPIDILILKIFDVLIIAAVVSWATVQAVIEFDDWFKNNTK